MEIRQLGYVGLQGADPKAWLDFATRIAVNWATQGELEARAVHAMAHLRDPAGNRVELFHGVTRDHHFASPAGVDHFITGPLGLGHVVLMVPEIDAALGFWCNTLGFR